MPPAEFERVQFVLAVCPECFCRMRFRVIVWSHAAIWIDRRGHVFELRKAQRPATARDEQYAYVAGVRPARASFVNRETPAVDRGEKRPARVRGTSSGTDRKSVV